MDREPVVAGRFYPGDEFGLQETIASYAARLDTPPPQQATAVVLPHAGYVYSGETAFATVSRVVVPEVVVLIGPNHSGLGAKVAISQCDWLMPWGNVPIHRQICAQLTQASSLFQHDDMAHLREHSLEVQLPFLHHFNPLVQIVPITSFPLAYEECEQVARALATIIMQQEQSVLLLASTDMSHYLSRNEARYLDTLAIEQIQRMDPRGLYDVVGDKHISMCGMTATVITLLAAMALGASLAELAEYTDSGVVNGDTEQVVGYAGIVLS